MVGLLVYLNFVMGPVQMLKLYGIPYWVGLLSLCLNCFYHRNECTLLNSHLNADICDVVGFSDLLASPWP
jgi:hypothetical protein